MSAVEGPRTLVITGGSRGIGAQIVIEAARQGWNVAFTYVQAKEHADTVVATAEDAARGGHPDVRVKCWQLDVRDGDAVDAVVDAVAMEFGGIHAVVANAGRNHNGLAFSTGDADWNDVIETNLTGSFHLCRAALPELIANRWGRILLLSSVAAGGASGQVAYAASKAGLHGVARTLAKEYGPKGVTANVVLPGFFETDMTAGEGMATELRDYALEYCPLRRTGELDELAKTILFLLSDAAGYINGAIVPVTGGLDWAP